MGPTMTFGNMFTAVEVGALVLVLWEFLWGLKRGLSGEFLRLIGTMIILIAGLRFYQTLGRLLVANTRLSENPELALVAAFLLIVVCFALLFFILRLILRILMSVKFNDKIDRPGGGLVGLLRGVLMVILCVYAIGLWPHEYMRDVVRRQSITGRTVFQYAPWAIEKLNAIRWLDVGVKPSPPSLLPPIQELPVETE
ncbi:MAG: CvpA family protein [Kiritimatiellae bacterium]|nr:CvpA family protein [Kiritimatiellia bacterium]